MDEITDYHKAIYELLDKHKGITTRDIGIKELNGDDINGFSLHITGVRPMTCELEQSGKYVIYPYKWTGYKYERNKNPADDKSAKKIYERIKLVLGGIGITAEQIDTWQKNQH